MTRSWKGRAWKLELVAYLALVGAVISSGDCATAQIAPDATLGAESSVVTPLDSAGFPVDRIDGGAIRGANLFHSFQEFNIDEGRGAYFTNPDAITNILSRVTGNDPSDILGTLGVLGNANLFLINPNGIIFGPSSSLDIGGSFVGSTASSLNFADGTQFSATAPRTTPLLTVSVPIGLQYGRTAGSILNQSQATDSSGQVVGLQVQPGETLALLGGDVSLERGQLWAPGGRVELGGVVGEGTVGLSFDDSALRLSFPDGMQQADVSLINGSEVNVRASDGGSIAINSRNLDVLGGSKVRAGIESGFGSIDSQAGDIDINATGAITIADELSFIANAVLEGAVGKGGDANITTGSLFVGNGGQVNSLTRGQGDAGSVNINARDVVSFDGVASNGDSSGIFSTVGNEAVGNGGSINITARSLSLTNGAQLNANTLGRGNAGSVRIQARDAVFFNGVSSTGIPSGAFSNVETAEAIGKGGNVNVTAGSLSLNNGAVLGASTFGQGDAGSVTINARDIVSFDGVGSNGASGAYSQVGAGAVGNGNGISIQAGSFSITNGALISTSTLGQGDAGSVTIQARDTISLSGASANGTSSGIVTATAGPLFGFTVVGDGGDINLQARSISLANNAQVGTDSLLSPGSAGNIRVDVSDSISITSGAGLQTAALGQGNAGSVTIQAGNTVFLNGSAIFTSAVTPVESVGSGKGGDINIDTGTLSVVNRASINAAAYGQADAGNVIINARSGSLILDNGASLSAATTSGEGGNITLQAQDFLLLRRNSQISATAGTARAGGNGGNIMIDAPFIIAVPTENSDISANAFTGNGGKVEINAQGIFGIQFRLRETPDESDITASSEFGLGGTVELNTPEVDPSRGLVELPAEVVDASGLIARGCAPGEGEGSQFVATGRGGLPPNPGEPLSGDAVWEDARLPATTTAHQQRSQSITTTLPDEETAPDAITPATGWVFNDKGEVTLIAQAPNAAPYNVTSHSTTCRVR